MKPETNEEKSSKQRISDGEILLRVILEMAGSPKEHIEKAITMLVDKLEEAEYVTKLVSEEVLEAEENKEHKDLFSTIAELEVWIKKEDNLVDLAFDFMPASIEVIEPEIPKVNNKLLSNFMNELLAKLHNSDLFVKEVSAQKQVLERNSTVLLRNFVISLLKSKDLSLEDLSSTIGLAKDQLNEFLGLLEKGNEIKKVGDKFSLTKNSKNNN